MRIFVIGNGGREHALAWKLAQSPQVTQIWVAPGNGGTARLSKCENVSIAAGDLAALADFARQNRVDLTVVGPEAPLVAGVADLFRAAGLAVFGPSQAAAQMEGSKAFSKQFMQRHAIPTAQAAAFDDFDEAARYLRGLDEAPVIKASGLAAGKGVILPNTRSEAASVLQTMLLDGRFGEAGKTVLIEEKLEGPELSVLAFCDGITARLMPAAQDHKRLMDDDLGPNTGGMGAFAPSPLATPKLMAEVERAIVKPTLAGLAAEGMPYVGVLYVGLMLTEKGPKVLEYNCRFGDPEAQVLLPLLETDLVDVILACIEGRPAEMQLQWRKEAAVTVVMAARGYPGEIELGVPITGIAAAEATGCLVFQAGAKWKEDRLLTDGGRVLAVTGMGATLSSAMRKAYAGVGAVHFNGAQFRKDIGRKTTAV